MYEDSFGFSKRPFASVPQVDHYFPGAAIEAARQTLARCIERAEGVGLVIGPSGTGKTLLARMLAEQFNDAFNVALLASGRLGTRRALLQAILFELGQPYRDMDEGELRLALVDYLTAGEASAQGMLLLVDEAHTLPLRLLDEIRMITNLVVGGQPRTRLVLAGSALLEERFASPKLDSFSQRISARCYLESFNREETQAYIHAQIAMAGREGHEVIREDACDAVYQATDGVPRLVNQVCDHALLLACAAGRGQVDRAVVEEAWADLQQLPTPWNGDASRQGSETGILEFGGLDDEPDEAGAAGGPGEAGHASHADEAASFPMLRVSAGPDEPDPDPVAQVERIERAVSDLDEDFQPVGSIGPEVELVFDGPHDPFSEEFEQEEAIVDRHGLERPIDSEASVDRGEPRQSVAEQEHSQESGGETAQAGENVEGQTASVGDEVDVSNAPETAEPDARDATTGEAERTGANQTDDRHVPHAWDGEPETLRMPGQRPNQYAGEDEAAEPEDEDLIIVEEGYDDFEPAVTRPVTTVRRHEYRQLFARLRRGG
jgi:type II secretory pathway predicted ATPase ExeA